MPRKQNGRPFLRIPFADRFWSKVARAYHPTDLDIEGRPALDFGPCWDWLPESRTGTQNLTGEIRLPTPSRKRIKAPRAALLLWEGATDQTIEAMNERRRHLDAGHSACDRPQCCNPTHLSWQPHKENIHEYIRKFQRLAGKAMDPNNLASM